jgi:hypoxanthine-DNA glycosylase
MESLARQQYYAHPRNSFWTIMGELAGAIPDLPYDARLDRLMCARIALWDVCAAAERAGSLDSAIKAPVANDFAGFFDAHREIAAIVFNGQPAAKLFQRLVRPGLTGRAAALPFKVLPSTSPAHAGMRYGDKLAAWRAAMSLA